MSVIIFCFLDIGFLAKQILPINHLSIYLSIYLSRSVCHTVLGQQGGACSDEIVGGINSHQFKSSSK